MAGPLSGGLKQQCAQIRSSQSKSLIHLAFLIVFLAAHWSASAQTRPSDLQPTAFFPPTGALGICPDTPLRITFSSPPILGDSGVIRIYDQQSNQAVESIDISSKTATQTIGGLDRFTYYPVIISGNDATIYPHNHSLEYGKTYYVTIDPGVFKNATDWPGFSSQHDWQFTTRDAGPAKGSTNLTVAADGSGDFCTIQGALDFVPANNTNPTTILIKKGNYTEIDCVMYKHSLTIKGEDRQGTVLSYSNNDKFAQKPKMPIYRRGVFLAYRCNDFHISNLTIRNTTPKGGSQAETIILVGSLQARAVLSDLDLYSFKDTLQINGQAYVTDCYINGDVDFVWGSGPCYFDNCHLYETRDAAYYTQVRNPRSNHGFVFRHCLLDGPADVTTSYLTRVDPMVYPNSEVVFLDCTIGKTVQPVGWLISKSKAATQPSAVAAAPRPYVGSLHFWEYDSRDEAGDPLDESGRLPASKRLSEPDDAATIAKYNDPGWVLGDGWNPEVNEGTAGAGK
jgi:pectin methylesterase-like acyl-CoA thioesterase